MAGRTYGLNVEVLQALREAWELEADLWVRVTNPVGQREAHISNGALVGGSSSLGEDRLGILLAEEGRYDVDLLEPMAKEAQAQGIRFGDLLVREKLFTQAEMDEALARQAATRLARLLTMPGLVSVGAEAERSVSPQLVAALVVEQFRSRLAPAELGPLVAQLEGRQLRPTRVSSELERLALTPEELGLLRHPAARGAEPFSAVGLSEPQLRLFCALFGLGVLELA